MHIVSIELNRIVGHESSPAEQDGTEVGKEADKEA